MSVRNQVRLELLEHGIGIPILPGRPLGNPAAGGSAHHEMHAALRQIGQLRPASRVIAVGCRRRASGLGVFVSSVEDVSVLGPEGVGVRVGRRAVPQADDDRHVGFLHAVARLAAVEEIVGKTDRVLDAGDRHRVENDAVLARTRGEPLVFRVASGLERPRRRLSGAGAGPQCDGSSRRAETRDKLSASIRFLGHVTPPGGARKSPHAHARAGGNYTWIFSVLSRIRRGVDRIFSRLADPLLLIT